MLGKKSEILDVVVQFLKENDWKYEKIEGKSALTTAFKGENVTCRCLVHANEHDQLAVQRKVGSSG
mgnify:CR=1 FL=1